MIENLKGENWSKFSSAKRLATLQDIENIIAEICEREPITLGVSDPYNTLIGVTQPGNVSNKIIEGKDPPYSFIRNHFYELRIAEIFSTIENENAENVVPENLYKIWEKNNSFSWFNEEEGCFLKEDHPDFNYQPIIASSHDFSNAAVKEVIKSVYRHGGLDNYIESFYINDLPRYRAYENREKNLNEIKMIWDKNDKIINACKDKLNYFKKNLETINRLRDNEFYYYFNEYIWFYLDNVERTKVMQELNYRELGEKGAREVNLLDIIEDTFKKGDENPSAAYALHKFYKAACIHELNYVLNYKSDEDYEFLQEVKLNLYKTPDKKHINFIDNIKYPLQRRVQPYGLFEADYINGKMSRLYPFGMEHLGIEGEIYEHVKAWDYYLNLYDKESLKKKIELMYGDFDIYYKKMIDKMTQNRKKQQENTKNL